MQLLMTWFIIYLKLSDVNHFRKHNLAVFVDIERSECVIENVKRELMVRFHSFEVIAELFPGHFTIIISIVSLSEELFNIIVADFGFNMNNY